jgi:hypothetical protein
MAIPIINFWEKYFDDPDEGLGSTYERFMVNEVLFKAVENYRISSVLETPSFGFTGVSGINSLGLALKNIPVTITDNNDSRLELIKNIWASFDVKANFDLVEDYCQLPYGDKSFDMLWNFANLWFVGDLDKFFKEASRVTKKLIIIMVPNRKGLGYLYLKSAFKTEMKKHLKEEFIIPENFIKSLKNHNWELMHEGYIDCPLWPDIAMSKEDFLKKIKLSFLLKKKAFKKPPLNIINFYNGNDTRMSKNMEKYSLFERKAPGFFKTIWSHHRYFIFRPSEQEIATTCKQEVDCFVSKARSDLAMTN